MKIRNILPYLLLFLCLVAVGWLFAVPAKITWRQDDLVIQAANGEHHFTVEIAETPAQQEFGLMYRTTLARDHGMLFIWEKDIPIWMWMKNTLIPLDMVFIDHHGRIVYIAANTTPKSLAVITAGQPVRAVLELAGGTAALDGIKAGDKAIHSYFTP